MPATAIMINARLQAAAERMWRDSKRLHDPEIWKRCNHRIMPLIGFDPPMVTGFNSDATPSIKEQPYLLLRPEPMLTSVRIIVTAPTISSEWFWIAARFHWRNGIEYNYTT